METIYIDEKGYQDYLDLIDKYEQDLKLVIEEKAYSYKEDTNAWHDNFAYEDASRKELELIARINEMKNYLQRAKIVSVGGEPDIVDIGSVVIIETDEEIEVKLIGGPANLDSDIMEVSINSPLGKAIYQKKEGTNISYVVGNMEHKGRIKRISN